MSNLQHIMIHCTATREGQYVDRKHIEKWHLRERGWSRVGYSALFLLDGTMQILIPFDKDDDVDPWEISNGARGWNGTTRHVAYVGGLDKYGNPKDTRTKEQYAAMQTFAAMHAMLWPDVKFIGHNQVSAKSCPSFDVPKWCEFIGIDKKTIDYEKYI